MTGKPVRRPKPDERAPGGVAAMVGASLFVILLILVLGQPILERGVGSQSGAETRPRDAPAQGPEDPKKEDAPPPRTEPSSPGRAPGSGTPGPVRLAGKYPKTCLRRAAAPTGGGLVAAFDGRRTTIASLTGRVGSVGGRAPIAWSPSGRLLATRGAELWTDAGNRIGFAFEGPVETWAWSTVSDCLLGIENGVLTVVRPLKAATRLVTGDISSFSLSPNGRRLAVLSRISETGDGEGEATAIALFDLATNRELSGVVGSGPASVLGEWSPDSRTLYYWSSPGESTLADGDKLYPFPGRVRTRQVFVPHDDFLRPCGDALIAVEGAGRDVHDDKNLVLILRGSATRALTTAAAGYSYTSPSCSFDGGFIAALREADGTAGDGRRLVVLSRDGSGARDISPGGELVDDYPLWGPRGTGVVFVRRAPQAKSARVWFFPEGGTARPLFDLQVVPAERFYGHFDWTPSIDWSADGSSGHPSG